MDAPHKAISRRDWLAAAALGAMQLSGAARAWRDGMLSPDDGELLWIGTYTEAGRREGVFVMRMDPATGALRRVAAVDAGENPSFLALAPDGRTLYAVNETTERAGKPSGGVRALRVTPATGALAPMYEHASEGGAPCYVSVTRRGRAVLVANYVGGSVAALPVVAGGGLGVATDVEAHAGRGPDAGRQESPHAHCIVPDPTGRWALACDLGADRVIVYRVDEARAGLARASEVAMKPGSGPRHLAFHPRLPLVYVANELDSTLVTLRWDARAGTLAPLASATTLPAGWSGHNQVADIHVARNGRALYVSNRGHDSIAVFALDGRGRATPLQHQPTEGHWPRNFALAPGGEWLLVANERSNSIVTLKVDRATGRLSATGVKAEVPKPVCVRFAALAR